MHVVDERDNLQSKAISCQTTSENHAKISAKLSKILGIPESGRMIKNRKEFTSVVKS